MSTPRLVCTASRHDSASQGGETSQFSPHNIADVLPSRSAHEENKACTESGAFAWIITDWTCISAGVPRVGLEEGPLKTYLDSAGLDDPLNNDQERAKNPLDVVHRQGGKVPSIPMSKDPLPPYPRKRRRLPESIPLDWPAQKIPLEVFDMIMSHLNRNDIKSLRLVCREFEQKTASFFRTVVLQFSPDIYGSSSLGVDKGPGHRDMRMFQERGWGIRRFALAFEFCEDLLKTRPPSATKPKLVATQHYYGDMNWPSSKEVCYEQIRELEVTADKIPKMKRAFSYLGDVVDLGLCLNSGLGWLNGPDESDRSRVFKNTPAIFQSQFTGSQRTHACHVMKHIFKGICDADPEKSSHEIFYQYARLLIPHLSGARDSLKMVAQYIHAHPIGSLTGLDGTALHNHVEMFVQAWKQQRYIERLREEQDEDLSEKVDRRQLWGAAYLQARNRRLQADTTRTSEFWTQAMLLYHELKDHACGYKSPSITFDQPARGMHPPVMFDGVDVMDEHTYALTQSYHAGWLSYPSIKPSLLTNLQLRLLKENEWAQRAFLNAFTLAVLDNQATMSNIQSLILANIGSSYLPLLNRKDLWEALPNVCKVTLNVSPDWREITLAPAFPLDHHECRTINPSRTLDKVNALLDDCIRDNPRIKDLTLGFVGGGEHASGIFARNRNILPAPIDDSSSHKPGCFPHVQKLTLINCWTVSDVLIKIVKQMQKASLTELKLESFSLVAFGGQTMPSSLPSLSSLLQDSSRSRTHKLGFSVQHPTIFDVFDFASREPPLTELVTRILSDEDLVKENPLPDTWGQVLNAITPGKNIEEQSPKSETGEEEPPERDTGSLVRIELASCGYVQLTAFQNLVAEFEAQQEPTAKPLLDRMHALQPSMMKSDDLHLGQIIPQYIESDRSLLTGFFGMRTGWPEGDERRLHNLEDGQPEGGSGRFSGVIQK